MLLNPQSTVMFEPRNMQLSLHTMVHSRLQLRNPIHLIDVVVHGTLLHVVST